MWYSFKTSSSFSFNNKLLCCLFAYCQTSPNFSNYQIVISIQSASLKDRTWSIFECHLPSINISSFEASHQRRSRCKDERFGANFPILTPLSLLSWCRLSYPIVGSNISSLPGFALKPPNRTSIRCLGKWSKPVLIPKKNCLLNHHFLLTRRMYVHVEEWYFTSYLSLQYPITKKLYSLNCWYCSVVYNKCCSELMIFLSFSIKGTQYGSSPALTVLPLSHLTSCTPAKSTFCLTNSLATVGYVTLACTGS
jgi:hypothetical protein